MLLLACSGVLSGCALFGKNEPMVPRYFTVSDVATAPRSNDPRGLQLRLGRVEGWSHLRERLVTRDASHELFFHEARRWTERPEIYLRAALARTLFEERGLTESLGGHALTLDVELVAFEELLTPHVARMQTRLVLRNESVALLEETITIEQPVATNPDGDEARAVADALSLALRAGSTRIADRVVERLTAAVATQQ
jgi:cholesterol transport system auxiliary component